MMGVILLIEMGIRGIIQKIKEKKHENTDIQAATNTKIRIQSTYDRKGTRINYR